MPYFLNKMVKFDDILFWILILMIIAVALWLLSGSPTEMGAIIAVALFVATSEILIWKYLFYIDKNNKINLSKIDKNTAISFIKLKNNMDNKFLMVNNKLDKIQDRLITKSR